MVDSPQTKLSSFLDIGLYFVLSVLIKIYWSLREYIGQNSPYFGLSMVFVNSSGLYWTIPFSFNSL